MKRLIYLPLFAALFFLSGCGDFKGSPFTDRSESGLRDSNARQLARLSDGGDDGLPLRFALISDSHQNITDLERAVNRINSGQFDFTAHLGDFTDSSYGMEYDLFIEVIRGLRRPWLVGIGNHDSIVEGKALFRKHFGSWNFSYEFKGIKFIFFNNISLEFSPDYGWLEDEVSATSLPVVIFQHIPPDGDTFSDDELAMNDRIIRNPNVKAVFHGHDHKFTTEFHADGTLIQQVARTEGVHWAEAEVRGGVMTVWVCEKDGCDEAVNYPLNN